jgi:hypothetical protein
VSLSDDFIRDLLLHAWSLLPEIGNESTNKIDMRRAVSAAYYALFHRINGDAVELIAPNVSLATNHRIQRWFEHAKMKEICGRFVKQTLDQPLLDLIGGSSSPELQTVCRNFIALQEARNSADYDLSYKIDWKLTVACIDRSTDAIRAWVQIRNTEEANVFILSLLMFKNWEEKNR